MIKPNKEFSLLQRSQNFLCIHATGVYVVVNFLSQVIFIFPLFLGMVIYANEFETNSEEKRKLSEIKSYN